MKRLNIMLALVLMFAWAACDTDVEHELAAVDAPLLVTSTPASGALKVKAGHVTITLTYDKNVFFATKDLDKLTLTGGKIVSADVYGAGKTLTITAITEREASCTLSVPEGVITGPNKMPAPAVSLNFTTIALDKSLVNSSATPEAQKVYAYLLENFETKTLSAMMANVAWNTEKAEQVYQWTGKYPAMNCFDYVHLPFSGQNWIDYGDITPVKSWWDAGGLVSAMWHWNVPTAAPEAFSTKIWEGETVIPSDWSGSLQLTDDAAKAIFAEAKIGNKVKVTTSNVAAGAQGSFKNGSWTEIAPGKDYFDISGDFELDITTDVLTSLQSGGMIISGHDYTITGVYLTGGSDGNVEYAFYKEKTAFDATNALTEGTWENKVFTEDLAKVAGYLKLLQDSNIPVIWRPFHEAAGGWFWWGKDADSSKKLWITMFDYFKSQGLNNLIWVWTCQTGDENWYPGDAYVDIIGCDIYGKSTDVCSEQYVTVAETYGNKMVALSECGTVGKISEQWASGARWSWFMPWYDAEDAETPHADQAWWKDAMEQNFVISREDLPDMK